MSAMKNWAQTKWRFVCAKKLPSTIVNVCTRSSQVGGREANRQRSRFFFVFFFAPAISIFGQFFFDEFPFLRLHKTHNDDYYTKTIHILSNKKKRCSSCAATSVAPVVGTALPALLRALPICFWSPPPPPPPRFRREERRFDETTTTTTDAVFQLTDTNARAQSLGGTAQPSEEE